MILFIDHRDSFSWNLIAQLRGLGHAVEVRQSEDIDAQSASDYLIGKQAVVFSPGPGHPRDYPNSLAIYHAAKGQLPIIGVCLGFQIMLEAEGISVNRLPEILHGVQTRIRIDSSAAAYRGVDDRPRVGRYHSLGLPAVKLPSAWLPTGWDADSGSLLSFENLPLRLFGFQYHPDSFLTPDGNRILANALAAGLDNKPRRQSRIKITTGDLWEQAGVFTTLRLSIRTDASSKVATLWFPGAHSQRMQRDLSALQLVSEDICQRQSHFIQATQSLASTLEAGEWLLRWSCAPPQHAIEARPLTASNPSLTGKCWHYLRRDPAQKNLYYSDLLAQMRLVYRASTEVLLVHPQTQHLLEGITCNLICVRNGQCFTPEQDCLPGLTLQLLESQLSANLKITRAAIPLNQLDQYDAMYACGTGRGVTPISGIPELNWQQRDHSLTNTLQTAYQSLIQSTHDRIEFAID